jgi:hypothetical protein
MLEKVQNDPISVKMLKINGNDLITIIGLEPGPKIGAILDVLLSEVISDPELNTKKYLESRAKELKSSDLKNLRIEARKSINDKLIIEDSKVKRHYKV